MKKILLLLAAVGMIFTACTPGDKLDEENNGNPTEQPGGGNQGGEGNQGGNQGGDQGGEGNQGGDQGDEGNQGGDQGGEGNQGGVEIPADKTQAIKFQDENTKLLCTLHWDENGDDELSYEEAAAVTDLGTAVKGSSILAFTELKYFTSLEKIADNAFEGCVSLVKTTLPEQITSIGTSAFNGCTNLKKIAIPNAVTEIGGSAFANCSNLTRVDITDLSAWCKIGFGNTSANPLRNGAKLYLNGSELTDITIPSDITEIKACAFSGYTSLTSITIPDSVTSIGERAFQDCTSLTSITIPNSVNEIGGEAFKGCTGELIINSKIIETDYDSNNYPSYNYYGRGNWLYGSNFTKLIIGNNITKIGRYAFKDCTSLPSITIPDSVTEIGGYAFYNCTSLTSITIPDSVTEIGGYAFEGCTGELIINSKIVETNYKYDNYPANSNNGWLYNAKFTKVTIGNGVTAIGSYAFRACTSLTSITIPDSVTSIGIFAFSGCSSLTRVDITDLSAWCKIGFGDGSANPLCNGAKLYLNGSELTDITIPSDITEIKAYAFSGCTSLTSVTIGNGVKSIGNSAFSGCSSLTRVDITDLSAWCKIGFGDGSANPLCYGAKLYLNGSELTDITIPSDITEIKACAFSGYTSLTSITIPDSVTSIGENAFYNCTSLTSITIPDSVTSIGGDAFYKCTSLTSATIGDSVTSIGRYAFYNCSSLTSVTLGNSVTEIGYYAFYGCKGELIINSKKLVETNYSSSSSRMHAYLYGSYFTKLIIGNNITKIGEYAFSSCTSLPSVTISDSVTSIGDGAFSDCTSLPSVTISDSVTSIGDGAFSDCTSLTRVDITDLSAWCKIGFGNYSANPLSNGAKLYLNGSELTDITIPSDITKIKAYAFRGCASLTNLTIPDSVTSIGNGAFYGCTSLTNLTIPDSVTWIGYDAFYGCTGELTVNCNIRGATSSSDGAFYGSKFTKVTIGDSVTSIGYAAFCECTSLTSVTIGNSVTKIGEWAFNYCTSLTAFYGKFASTDNRCLIMDGVLKSFAPADLTEYTIPNSVTSIVSSAFYGCTSLTSVTIPNSVTSIGWSAFRDCRSLTSVYCKPTTPPTGNSYMFDNNASGRKVYVPRNSVEAYKAAQYWSNYASSIEGYDF